MVVLAPCVIAHTPTVTRFGSISIWSTSRALIFPLCRFFLLTGVVFVLFAALPILHIGRSADVLKALVAQDVVV